MAHADFISRCESGVDGGRPSWRTADERRVADLVREFDRADAEHVIRRAWEIFGSHVKLATSFAPEGVLLIDTVARVAPRLRVFTIDTGRLHEETHELIDRIRKRYRLQIEVYFPERDAVERLLRREGPYSFRESVEKRRECCAIRKVEPLRRALADARAWITGVRREQAPTRSDAAIVEWDAVNERVKINPLLHWRQSEVMRRIRERGLPTNRLLELGYRSIGCAPCTRPVARGECPRAGRWWWEHSGLKECGLHR